MLRVGIIGSAGHFRFALESADNYHTSIIAAFAAPQDGTDDQELRRLAIERNAPFYEDWRHMLDAEALDVVVVDNRYDLHAAAAIECLQRGKHVYVEKPLATTLADLNALTEAYHATSGALGGMFNYRYSPWFLTAADAIASGMLGEIRLLHGQKSYKYGVRPDFYRDRSLYGGMIPWVAIHALDWCMALGGDCRRVAALSSARCNRDHGEMEMTSTIMLELQNEALCTVTADFLRPIGAPRHDDDRLRVTGTKGMLEVVDGQVYLEDERPKRQLPLLTAGDPFGAFVRAIEASEADSFARDALRATQIALLARQAADEHRMIEL